MVHDFCQLCVDWLIHYGPIILFFGLALGIIALPIPDDTLLLVAGMLIENGTMAPITTFIASLAGSIVGITVSYMLGRLAGPWIVKKCMGRFGLKEERLEKASIWFHRIGKWALLVCYFFPVLRHVVGFVAGSSRMHVGQFMLYAYSGAVIWVTSYLLAGYYLKKLAAHGIKLLF